MFYKKFVYLIFLLLMGSLVFGGTKNSSNNKPNRLGKVAIFSKRAHNINRLFMPITNYSEMGQSNTGNAGTFWPYPAYLDAYIFGAGIWVGALDSIGIDEFGDPIYKPLVTVGYNPNDGSSEFAPGVPPNSGGTYAGETGPLERVLLSTDDKDRAEWPLEDSEGNKIIRSDQDSYAAYNDLDYTLHAAEEGFPVENRPLQIQIDQIGYAWGIPAYQDIIFMTYEIINIGNSALKSVYLGVVCDPDIGDASDDQINYFLGPFRPTESDTFLNLNLGYAYDDDGKEASFTNPNGPGVIGYNFMESPVAKKDTYIDPAQTILIPAGQQLGMTSFKQFTLSTDPKNDEERYLTMRGINPVTGQYKQLDKSQSPDDMRFIQNTGPFDLDVGDTARVVVAIMAAQDAEALKKAAYKAQGAYNQGFILPSPPPSPNLTLVPGDKEVTVIWDNLSEITPDPFYPYAGADSSYKEFDFEGYRIYRSENGADWTLVDSADVIDGIGADIGLHYSFVDKDLINGYPYYYSVTAYDHNSVPSLESGINNNAAQSTPRSYADNYVPPANIKITSLNNIENGALHITSNILKPFEVEPRTYDFKIINTTTGDDANSDGLSVNVPTSYTAVLTSGTFVDTLIVPVTYDPGFDLLEITRARSRETNGSEIELNESVDTKNWKIEDAKFTNADTSLVENITASVYKGAYGAFSAGNYSVDILKDSTGDMTLSVIDTKNNAEVPFGTGKGQNWGIVNLSPSNPFIQYFKTAGANVRPADIYIAGVLIKIAAKGNFYTKLAGTNFEVQTSGPRQPIVGDDYMLEFESAASYAQSSDMNQIKVVPDPYVVRNEWEGGYEYEQIQFTHLPDKCTIRIFTVSGELIKTIEHTATSASSSIPDNLGGTATWNLLTDSDRKIASGIYIYHVDSGVGSKIGRFAVIR